MVGAADEATSIERFSALMMPFVTVPDEAERRADRDRRVADVELVGVGELERGEAARHPSSLMTARSDSGSVPTSSAA